MKPKQQILECLKNHYPSWKSGAELEDMDFGCKASTISRDLRKLYNQGLIAREYRKLEYRNDEQVFYRWKEQEPKFVLPQFRREVIQPTLL